MIVGQPSHGFSASHIHSMVNGAVFVCGHIFCMKSMVNGGVFICGHIFCMKTIGKIYYDDVKATSCPSLGDVQQDTNDKIYTK